MPGGTITSTYDFLPLDFRYVRYKREIDREKRRRHAVLTISWPEWKRNVVTLEQLTAEVEAKAELVLTSNRDGKPLPANHDIALMVATGTEEPQELKHYPIDQWPKAFIDDLATDPHMLDAYSFLRVQPMWNGLVTYTHTDDYMDAAEGYGEDVERETTVKERRPTGNKLEFHLK